MDRLIMCGNTHIQFVANKDGKNTPKNTMCSRRNCHNCIALDSKTYDKHMETVWDNFIKVEPC